MSRAGKAWVVVVAIVGAVVLRLNGVEGAGWLIFLAVLALL